MKINMVPGPLRVDALNLLIIQEQDISEFAKDLSNTLRQHELKEKIERFEICVSLLDQLNFFPEHQVEKFKKVAQRYKDLVREKELALLERVAR